jgi:hypothetical protein
MKLFTVFGRGALQAALFSSIGIAAGAVCAQEEGIVTDRPDFVESSKVVGKGCFQLETSVAQDRDNQGASRQRTWTTPTLLRFGVGDALELRVETDGRTIDRGKPAVGPSTTSAGYADTALGVKWHVLDDEGRLPSITVTGRPPVSPYCAGPPPPR